MDPSFFDNDDDVAYVPQPNGSDDGEIYDNGNYRMRSDSEGEANPMEKLESIKIKDQVDDLMKRLFSGFGQEVPSTDQQQQGDEEMKVDGNDDIDSYSLMKSTTVHRVAEQPNTLHEVVIPSDALLPQLRPANVVPAHSFPFELDPFQKEAIQVIENEQSLLVAAHTSAGKTAVAQYAIAEALRSQKFVIYTSPIKALSNQKYRELEEIFDSRDVGLMTGDVTLNPMAPIQVMTTEIMRSMLYKKSPLFSQVAWVIFDEIHYMNNEERGVVWEESIILLDPKIRLLFLSATIPNAQEFAGWVCSQKRTPIHIVSTKERPVPLCHYVLPVGSETMHEILTNKGQFRESQLVISMSEMQKGLERERMDKRKNIKDSTLLSLTRTLIERDLMPTVAFSFSRADCEHYATVIKDMDMNRADEKSRVRGMVEIAIDRLTDEDRKLSQIQHLLPLFERGIAVHHSGLLPVVKEIVELLVQEGLIKMLFATETFAMGINGSTRAVVFSSAKKFDGKTHRWLSASEYAQMSGRAGRRKTANLPISEGVVITMLDERIKTSEMKKIVQGALDPLRSQFRLSYNMLLNLVARREIRPEEMMKNSLRQYQNTAEVPDMSKAIAEKEAALALLDARMDANTQESVDHYYSLQKGIERLKMTTKKMYMTMSYLLNFLNAGRLLKVKMGDLSFGWGVLIRFERKTDSEDSGAYIYILEVLIEVDRASTRDFNSTGVLKPASAADGQTSWEVVPMTVDCIEEIAAARFFVPENMKDPMLVEKLATMVTYFVNERMAGQPTLLDPIKDMEVRHPALQEALDRLREYESQLERHALTRKKRGNREEIEQFEDLTRVHREKEDLEKELKELRTELRKKRQDIRAGTELFRKKEVLLKLGYITEQEELTKKGKIAACISTGDELMLTELIVGKTKDGEGHEVGVLDNVTGDERLAALLSCFVCDEASAGRLSSDMNSILKIIQDYARRIARQVNKTGQVLAEGEYVDCFKPALMEATKQWVKGVHFGALLKSTDLYEGSIIRSLRRLEELLREMAAAAKVADNSNLQDRFDDIRLRIRRDIVFAASLYL